MHVMKIIAPVLVRVSANSKLGCELSQSYFPLIALDHVAVTLTITTIGLGYRI